MSPTNQVRYKNLRPRLESPGKDSFKFKMCLFELFLEKLGQINYKKNTKMYTPQSGASLTHFLWWSWIFCDPHLTSDLKVCVLTL